MNLPTDWITGVAGAAGPALSWMRPSLGLPLGEMGASVNLVKLFEGAELAGQVIVVLLILFSLIAWTVMIGKYLDLKRWRAMNLSFLAKMRQEKTLLDTRTTPALRLMGPYAELFFDALAAGRVYRAEGNDTVRLKLIENALQRGVAEICVRYEARMVVLGSLVSGAPFIGLLGTVWGVMVAFSAMGASGGGMTIQTLAPGIASALLATVSGLVVAIPSNFGYNFLLTHVKMLITELENFASSLADRLELELEAQHTTVATVAAGVAALPALVPGPIAVKSDAVRTPEAPSVPLPAESKPAAAAPVDPGIAAAERFLRFDASDGGK